MGHSDEIEHMPPGPGPTSAGKALLIGTISGLLRSARERLPVIRQMQFDPNTPHILVEINESGDGTNTKWYIITAERVKIDNDGNVKFIERGE